MSCRILLLFLAATIPCAPALELSLNALPARVRDHHPRLKAARWIVTQAEAVVLGSGRLSNPQWGLNFQRESDLSPASVMAEFQQSFPMTDRLRLEKHVSQLGVDAARWEVADMERRLIATAQELAVEILHLKAQSELLARQIELAQDLTTFTEGRVKSGEISALEAGQAQLERHRLRVEAQSVRSDWQRKLAELKPHLGVVTGTELELTGKLSDLSLPTSRAGHSRPDMKLAQQRVTESDASVDLEKSRRWEDATAGLFAAAENQRVSGGREHTGFVGFRFSMPWPLWNRNQGPIAEAEARAGRARQEVEALQSEIQAEVAAARSEMEAHANLASSLQSELLPLAEEQIRLQEKAYREGQTDLLTLLRTREQRLRAEASLLGAQRAFHLARIRYEAATAAPHPLPSPTNP